MTLEELIHKKLEPPTTHIKKTGIYLIYNVCSKKGYIGSSLNIYRRWVEHRTRLAAGKHPNIHLQRAWDKDKKDSFIFFLIEETHKLDEREKFYLDSLSYNLLYNCKNSQKPRRKNYTLSEEARKKSRERMKGNKLRLGKKHPPEVLEKISDGRRKAYFKLSKEKRDEIHELSRKAISKISEETVKKVKERLALGERPFAIAKSLSIKSYFVMNIKNGSSWKDI